MTHNFPAKSQPDAIAHLKKALKDIYFISGLGADKRVFQALKFEGYQPVHIQWLEPERDESIELYAQRLATQITSDRPILVGLSFGGMIAVEIAKQIPVEKVILISSVKRQSEVPFYFKLFRWFPIHRIFPFKTLLWAEYWFADLVFSAQTVDERKLLRAILFDTDAHFLKWALHKVVTWKNETTVEQVYHVHGSGDRIFPVHFANPDYTIQHGGHLMVLHEAAQISALIEKVIR